MAKITDYPVLTQIDPETEYVVIAYNGENYKVLAGNLSFVAPHYKMVPLISDFMNTLNFPFAITTPSAIFSDNNHPGYLSATAIRLLPGGGPNYVFIGGESAEIVFLGAASSRFGIWHDPSLEGIYVNIDAGLVLTGVSHDGSPASTPSSYTITAGTWYRARINMDSAKTQVSFYLYAENGALLWSGSVFSNIPVNITNAQINTTGRFVDWVAIYNTSVLSR